MGYIMGVGNDKFGVGIPIDRQSTAVLLYRYAEKNAIDISDKANLYMFTDNHEISSWAVDACRWAVNYEILGSTAWDGMLLSPQMTLTRAQAAKIFMYFDNNVIQAK